ncbi:uncharacterized protein LOC128953615 [Oppia nitens]|uniref:uncharacterized protein LOC128953615 n=1 Tax=Oppia nitens TaxID=1686743 RepID=UPI0023D9F6C8|nr:uncharacterized protein LOC128953615 [Oppia nitens]
MAHTYHQTSYKAPGVWQQGYSGQVPHGGPVLGGNDVNGESLYVGRAIESGDCIPGKVVPSHGCCYVAFAGQEHSHRDYQVLTNPHGASLVWVPAANGEVPLGAIQGGQQSDGERLYIGRAYHEGSMVIGKVHPNHRTLYVSFGGNEVAIHHYECLVCREINHVRAPLAQTNSVPVLPVPCLSQPLLHQSIIMGEWHPYSGGNVPGNAVAGGNDTNGETIFVGRAHESGDLIPGKIVPSHGVCYVPYDGQERAHRTYEYLVAPSYGSLVWRSAGNGGIPSGAVHGGRMSSGEPLFIGRAYHEGSWVIGKVQQSHQVLYVPYGGNEIAIHSYEVLVEQY